MFRALVTSLGILALVLAQGQVLADNAGSHGSMMLAQQTAQPTGSTPTFADVSAILAGNCTICHAPPSPAGGLRLDNHAGLLKGGRSGPAVVPGDPEKSELIRRLRGSSTPRMPMSGPPWLPEEKIALIEQWIKAGAKDGGSSGGQK